MKVEGGSLCCPCETAALAPKIDVLALGAMQMQVFLLSVKKKVNELTMHIKLPCKKYSTH
jgi:hypothetical protein